jgi:hypothetical protein
MTSTGRRLRRRQRPEPPIGPRLSRALLTTYRSVPRARSSAMMSTVTGRSGRPRVTRGNGVATHHPCTNRKSLWGETAEIGLAWALCATDCNQAQTPRRPRNEGVRGSNPRVGSYFVTGWASGSRATLLADSRFRSGHSRRTSGGLVRARVQLAYPRFAFVRVQSPRQRHGVRLGESVAVKPQGFDASGRAMGM